MLDWKNFELIVTKIFDNLKILIKKLNQKITPKLKKKIIINFRQNNVTISIENHLN